MTEEEARQELKRGKRMTFDEIRNHYREMRNHYQECFKEHFIQILFGIGLWDVPVKDRQSNKIGKFKLLPSSFSSIGYDLKFYPYNKKGEITTKYNNVYVNTFGDEEEIKEEILKKYETAGEKCPDWEGR